jgi:hypothetical protein
LKEELIRNETAEEVNHHVHLFAQTISGAVPADAAGEVAAVAAVYGL